MAVIWAPLYPFYLIAKALGGSDKGTAPNMGAKWQYLGTVSSPTVRGNRRSIVRGSNPKILEWVRMRITERWDEFHHWGDSITIRGSYWEYRIQLCETRILTPNGGGTHGDDGVRVWRRRV